MREFDQYLRKGELEFYNQGMRLAPQMKSPRALASELVSLSGGYLTLKGDSLETLLSNPENLSSLAEFATSLYIQSIQERKSDLRVHIDVDISKIPYPYSVWGKVANGLGQVQFSTEKWLASYPPIFKDWHLSLCEEIGRWIGYPGYEWPRTEREFLHEIVNQVDSSGILLGNQENCKVYLELAREYPVMKENIQKTFANFFNLPN